MPLMLDLDPASSEPLHHQVYGRLREAILSGKLAVGSRLPSTRVLAADLDVSRNTILAAFAQLTAEGYLEGRVGSGTRVSTSLPDAMLRAGGTASRPRSRARGRLLSRRGTSITALPSWISKVGGHGRPFAPGVTAFDQFPVEVWGRLIARRWKRAGPWLFDYGDPAGYRPLREAIAAYLETARGVRCVADQVIVVSGSQQALDLAGRVLLDPGDTAWIEDPGYVGARGALVAAGARLTPVPIDDEGLDFNAAARLRTPRLVYTTPSYQFPLGVTMTLARRLAWLEWAHASGVRIIEDDYDSEFRYGSRPLASLQGLDDRDVVIYVGSFSKVLFPSLRLGYLVVPPPLVDAVVNARRYADGHAPIFPQAVLADFMSQGHFDRYLRRIRTVAGERQQALVEACHRELDGVLEVRPAEAGMHLVGWLAPNADDEHASRLAADHGVDAIALSTFSLRRRGRPGLVLGYAGIPEPAIRDGVRLLALALTTKHARPGRRVAAAR